MSDSKPDTIYITYKRTGWTPPPMHMSSCSLQAINHSIISRKIDLTMNNADIWQKDRHIYKEIAEEIWYLLNRPAPDTNTTGRNVPISKLTENKSPNINITTVNLLLHALENISKSALNRENG